MLNTQTMKKTRFIFFLVLALLALVIIWCDYTDGHGGEDVMKVEFCPICALFSTTEVPQSLRGWFDTPCLLFVGSISIFFALFKPVRLFQSLFALRAPPVSR